MQLEIRSSRYTVVTGKVQKSSNLNCTRQCGNYYVGNGYQYAYKKGRIARCYLEIIMWVTVINMHVKK